ncbi:hypothetical protein Lal_00027453 [Lupinus albus]|nr:hypothetical protein Lal_00027453 [Lupinus albus]
MIIKAASESVSKVKERKRISPILSSKNEGENACTNCPKSINKCSIPNGTSLNELQRWIISFFRPHIAPSSITIVFSPSKSSRPNTFKLGNPLALKCNVVHATSLHPAISGFLHHLQQTSVQELLEVTVCYFLCCLSIFSVDKSFSYPQANQSHMLNSIESWEDAYVQQTGFKITLPDSAEECEATSFLRVVSITLLPRLLLGKAYLTAFQRFTCHTSSSTMRCWLAFDIIELLNQVFQELLRLERLSNINPSMKPETLLHFWVLINLLCQVNHSPGFYVYQYQLDQLPLAEEHLPACHASVTTIDSSLSLSHISWDGMVATCKNLIRFLVFLYYIGKYDYKYVHPQL